MDKRDKIEILKGVVNLIGIAMIVLALVYAVKLRERHGCDLRECVYRACEDCPDEPTGLYGNCDWIKDKITYTTDYTSSGKTREQYASLFKINATYKEGGVEGDD